MFTSAIVRNGVIEATKAAMKTGVWFSMACKLNDKGKVVLYINIGTYEERCGDCLPGKDEEKEKDGSRKE